MKEEELIELLHKLILERELFHKTCIEQMTVGDKQEYSQIYFKMYLENIEKDLILKAYKHELMGILKNRSTVTFKVGY